MNTSSRFVANGAIVAVATGGVTADSSLINFLDAGTSTITLRLFTSATFISSTHCDTQLREYVIEGKNARASPTGGLSSALREKGSKNDPLGTQFTFVHVVQYKHSLRINEVIDIYIYNIDCYENNYVLRLIRCVEFSL